MPAERLPMRRPLLGLAVAYSLGLVLADALAPPPVLGFALAGGMALAAGGLALARRGGPLRFLLWLLALLALGLARGVFPAAPAGEPPEERAVVRGRALSGWARGPDSLELRLALEAVQPPLGDFRPLGGVARLRVLGGEEPGGLAGCPEVLPGDRVRALSRLRPVRGPANFGLPDASLAQRRQGLYWSGKVASCRDVLLELEPVAPSLARLAARSRSAVGALLAGREGPPEARAVLAALTTGDTAGLSPEVRQAFARSGLAHLLSISGLHLGLVALGLYLALRWLLVRLPRLALRLDVRRLAACLCLPALGFYVLLTGAQAPVVRAGVMVAAFLVAEILRRRADAAQTLAAAALVILGLWPQALFGASFQLSFAAAAGLVLAAPRLCAFLGAPLGAPPAGAWARLRARLLQLGVVSLVAGLATAPLVAHHFGQVSWMGLLANLAAVPLSTWLIVPLGLGAAVLLPLGAVVAGPVADLGVWLCQGLVALARLLGGLPGAALELNPPGWLGVALAYALLLGLLVAGRGRLGRGLAAAAGALLVVGLAWSAWAPRLGGGLELVVLDVGQGDAILVRLPDGADVLVDGGPGRFGPGYDPAARVLLPALGALGVRRLEAVVATHRHPDHTGGLPAVLRELRPRALWWPPRQPWAEDEAGSQAHAEVLAAAREVGAEVRELGQGDRPLERGGASLEVLWPPRQGADALDENERSLVLRVALGERRALLAADLEGEGERALTAGGGDLRAELLKVGHHGSQGASA
ncbi:MAG TPA: DNA internalization-related competence protein ComEC/Rec2, partial [Myxococcota bacterium]|nr:DNA internalization-related competence protein ComEC/Rec2 [Myxococcota bacterium]